MADYGLEVEEGPNVLNSSSPNGKSTLGRVLKRLYHTVNELETTLGQLSVRQTILPAKVYASLRANGGGRTSADLCAESEGWQAWIEIHTR